jgi:FkbM family methyltransferase
MSMLTRSILPILLLVMTANAEPKMVREDKAAGLELWDTKLGPLWIPKGNSAAVIKHLEWEQEIDKVYDYPSAKILKGDIVIDCGAHIGGFTRTALRAGAQRVIAIEPELANIRAFRRNYAAELKSGKVTLIEKGIWDKSGSLSLHLSQTGDSHSVNIAQNGGKDESIQVITLDELAKELRLPRIDFIKMDIEGSEKNALKGAGNLITKWHPRLAISSYHQYGDPAAICTIIWGFHPRYLIGAKEILKEGANGKGCPKVLFFY